MNSFSILDAASPTDRARWVDQWNAWTGHEVSAHPDYVRLFARSDDRVLCASMHDSEGGVLFPFLLRPLASEPWGRSFSSTCDLVTPYGYGGPFAWGAPSASGFWEAFDGWAQSQGAISLFARLSLFEDQLIPFSGETEVKGPNVVRSLDLDESQLWMDYQQKVRKNVKRAREAGLEVEIDSSGSRLNDFLEIYYSTMDRRQADEGYYFPKEFFQKITVDLPGQFSFFHVLNQGKVVSTELVLVSASYMYSFLGGTRSDSFELRPNDLLKHEIILWGAQLQKKAFVLGGGYSGEDGIFRYKTSFAPTGTVPFMVGKKVYDVETYQRLSEVRREHAAREDSVWSPRPGFFPEYRG